jgi:hypothetical protein
MAKLTGKDAELASKIQALLAEYGYRSTRYYVSHDATTARFTINTDKIVKDADGNVDPFAKAKREFKNYVALTGFKADWLDKEFSYGGKRFVFRGFDMAKPKNNCVITDARTGKVFIAPENAVKSALERA